MSTIQEKRKEFTLNKVFRYEEGVMSRREWLKLKLSQGWTVEQKEVRQYAAEDKLEQWLFDHSYMNSGNPEWPDTKHWQSEKERAKQGIYKTEYCLCSKQENSIFDITKTEFNYVKEELL